MDSQVPAPGKIDMKTITWIIYGLWGGGILIHFLPLIALIILFLKRKEAAGTIFEGHFEWVLRTFAIGIVAGIIMGVLAGGLGMVWLLPVAGIPLGLWGLYRLVKGVLRLAENRAIENPKSLI